VSFESDSSDILPPFSVISLVIWLKLPHLSERGTFAHEWNFGELSGYLSLVLMDHIDAVSSRISGSIEVETPANPQMLSIIPMQSIEKPSQVLEKQIGVVLHGSIILTHLTLRGLPATAVNALMDGRCQHLCSRREP
jgi:hypothetical protein